MPHGLKLSVVETHALEALCDSLEQLTLAERFALCQALAAHLSERLGLIRAPAMSAEKFLLLLQRAAHNARRSAAAQES
jgi:hypothetical protein